MRHLSFALFSLLWFLPAIAFAAEPIAPTGYGPLLIKMILILAGVCVLAWVSLRWGLRRFVAPGQSHNPAMEVVARMAIEPRRSLLVVRIGPRHLVLGTSEAGIQPLTELAPAEAESLLVPAPPKRDFSAILSALRPAVSRETSPTHETDAALTVSRETIVAEEA